MGEGGSLVEAMPEGGARCRVACLVPGPMLCPGTLLELGCNLTLTLTLTLLEVGTLMS